MRRCLVIGAAGQIGSDLLPALVARGDEVWMADLLPPEKASAAARQMEEASGTDRSWRERWRVVDASAPAIGELVEQVAPDVVFHLAALLSARGEEDPARCWTINMASLQHVLEALAKRDDGPVLLWPSSIAVFGPLPGGQPYPAQVPDDYPLQPTTIYGVTKVAGELMGSYWARRYGVDFRSLRFPGLLSAVPPGGGSSDFANLMYFAAARGEPQVEIFVEPRARIPFMHMADAVGALLMLAGAEPGRLTRRVYNVTAFAPSAEEIAASIRAEGCSLAVSSAPDRRQAIVDSWPDDLDDGPARSDWGWEPALDLAGTTRRLLAEIRALGPADTARPGSGAGATGAGRRASAEAPGRPRLPREAD